MQTDNNHLMRIRLISDILEDYQDNIRRVLRLIETEQSIVSQDASANHTYGNIFVNVDASSLTYENESSPVNPRPPTLSAALTPRVGVLANASSNPTFGNILVNTNDRGNVNNYNHFQPENPAPIHRTVISDSSRSEFSRYTHNALTYEDESSPDNPRPPTLSAALTPRFGVLATTPITWDASMHQMQCPITWDSFTPGQSVLRINGCGHIFSRDAIIEWFRRRNHCPVCRALPVLTEPPQNYGNPSASLLNSYNIATSFITVDPGLADSDISGNIRTQQEYYLFGNNTAMDATMDSIINNLTTAILRRLEFDRNQGENQSDAMIPQIDQSGNNIIQNNEYYNDQLLFLNTPFNDAEEILPMRPRNSDM
jgi:hypothetical protein